MDKSYSLHKVGKVLCQETKQINSVEGFVHPLHFHKLNILVSSVGSVSSYELSELSVLRKWYRKNKALTVQQNGRVSSFTTLYIRTKRTMN